MAATTKTWVNNNPPQVDDVDLNGFKLENNNLISSTGQVLNTLDNDQTTKAVSAYAAGGTFYTDSGVPNSYILAPVGGKLAPATYFEGMKIAFFALNTNTGPSVVNVDSLGSKVIKRTNGDDLVAGEIVINQYTECVYDGTDFILLNDANIVTGITNSNILIGGNFGTNPWQRGESLSITSGGYNYLADRFALYTGSAITGSLQMTRDFSVLPPVNLIDQLSVSSLKVECTGTQGGLPATNAAYNFDYFIEGFDFQKIAQQNFVVGMAIRTNKTGVYCVSFTNEGKDRAYVHEINVSVADTWQYYQFVVTASPSSGTWNYEAGFGLEVLFALAPTVNQTTSTDQWLTGAFETTPNQVNFMDTIGNEIYLNFFKIEPGTIFTGWEEPQEGAILDLCQRYYQKSYDRANYPGAITNTNAQAKYLTKVGADVYDLQTRVNTKMRSLPTVTWYSPQSGSANNIYNFSTASDVSVIGNVDQGESSTGAPRASAPFGSVEDLVVAHYTLDAELP